MKHRMATLALAPASLAVVLAAAGLAFGQTVVLIGDQPRKNEPVSLSVSPSPSPLSSLPPLPPLPLFDPPRQQPKELPKELPKEQPKEHAEVEHHAEHAEEGEEIELP